MCIVNRLFTILNVFVGINNKMLVFFQNLSAVYKNNYDMPLYFFVIMC